MRQILICIMTMMVVTNASAGVRDVGNGGDAIVLEFTTLARQVVKDISFDAQYLFPEFSAESLETAIEKTTVTSVDQTILNGIEKDAVNFPSLNLIEVNRTRWMGQTLSAEKLRALVLHEYLGIMNINDSDFKISGRLIEYYLENKKRIISYELLGRMFLTAQDNADTQGLLVIEQSDKISFEGIINGESLNCSGTFNFNYNDQYLKSQLQCGDKEASLVVSFWNTDVVDYLRSGLVEIDLTFNIPNSDSSNTEFRKTIDAKHLTRTN